MLNWSYGGDRKEFRFLCLTATFVLKFTCIKRELHDRTYGESLNLHPVILKKSFTRVMADWASTSHLPGSIYK